MGIQETRFVKGKKLVWVDLGRGQRIQMYEEEARAKGLLPGESKARRVGRNKARQAGEDK